MNDQMTIVLVNYVKNDYFVKSGFVSDLCFSFVGVAFSQFKRFHVSVVLQCMKKKQKWCQT